MVKKVAILANGGDVSGFNAVIRAIVKTAENNGIECYEIRTTREKLYIDRNTLYPVYLEYKQENSNRDKEKIKVEYIFKENCVKDEDMKLPNLENYVLEE